MGVFFGHQPQRFCSSVGLIGISFVRASETSSRTCVNDALGALERKKDGCLLGDVLYT